MLGLGLIAAARFFDILPLSAGLHGITIGALGILTLVMMVRVTLQRTRQKVAVPLSCLMAIWMIALAAVARVAAVVPEWHWGLMVTATVCWMAAFVILIGFLVRAVVRSSTRAFPDYLPAPKGRP